MECFKENFVCCVGNIYLVGKCICMFCYVYVICFKYIVFKVIVEWFIFVIFIRL